MEYEGKPTEKHMKLEPDPHTKQKKNLRGSNKEVKRTIDKRTKTSNTTQRGSNRKAMKTKPNPSTTRKYTSPSASQCYFFYCGVLSPLLLIVSDGVRRIAYTMSPTDFR